MESKEQSKEKSSAKAMRKQIPFIQLSKAGVPERNIKKTHKSQAKFENLEKIQFRCQPKSRDSSHISLDGISKNNPLKEIIYRLMVNNRGKIKLGEIVERTLEILKGRRLSGIRENEDINMYFYKILKEDKDYSFEEID